jgi:hypothetical protein
MRTTQYGDVYVCNSCGLLREGSQVPTGWIRIVKHTPSRPVGLGFYCSADCLEQKVKILVKAEEREGGKGL